MYIHFYGISVCEFRVHRQLFDILRTSFFTILECRNFLLFIVQDENSFPDSSPEKWAVTLFSCLDSMQVCEYGRYSCICCSINCTRSLYFLFHYWYEYVSFNVRLLNWELVKGEEVFYKSHGWWCWKGRYNSNEHHCVAVVTLILNSW
jgi:hypothetical protein